MKTLKTLTLLLAVVVLAGCGEEKIPPKDDGEKNVQEMQKEIQKEIAKESLGISQKKEVENKVGFTCEELLPDGRIKEIFGYDDSAELERNTSKGENLWCRFSIKDSSSDYTKNHDFRISCPGAEEAKVKHQEIRDSFDLIAEKESGLGKPIPHDIDESVSIGVQSYLALNKSGPATFFVYFIDKEREDCHVQMSAAEETIIARKTNWDEKKEREIMLEIAKEVEKNFK